MLFLYSLSVSGSVMQMHFCGDNISSVSFSKQGISCCCSDDAENKPAKGATEEVKQSAKSCCDNVELSFKVSADHQHTEAASNLQSLQTALPLPLIAYEVPKALHLTGTAQHLSYFANAPPDGLWQAIPLYKLFQRIVYYG
ncbi:hypothetical protein DBR32_09605 [Taibaiella sp. KBW10]|nr:hypothetical protein DBR32_09605 [Taibaiella sp. KBW10]